MLMKTCLNLAKLSALGKDNCWWQKEVHKYLLGVTWVPCNRIWWVYIVIFKKEGGGVGINQPNQQTHPPPEVHMNKAYCYRTFVRAVNSSPHE